MNQEFIYSIISVVIVSLISLIGVIFLSVNKNILQKIVLTLVAFAAGSLIGDAFIHIIPEINEISEFDIFSSFSLIIGIFIFFIMEKFLRWRHCHDKDCVKHNIIGPMNLFGDAFHNFIDGLIIGGSFLVSIPLGITTSIAVMLHEIPQEIGDFGVLIHSGFSRQKAILYNFLVALSAIMGVLAIYLIGYNYSEKIIGFILPFTAGGFIYIALSDLIPELHKETRIKSTFWHLIFFALGISMMALLLKLE